MLLGRPRAGKRVTCSNFCLAVLAHVSRSAAASCSAATQLAPNSWSQIAKPRQTVT